MIRKLLAALFAALLLTAFVGCSSEDSDSDDKKSEESDKSSDDKDDDEEESDDDESDDEEADDEEADDEEADDEEADDEEADDEEADDEEADDDKAEAKGRKLVESVEESGLAESLSGSGMEIDEAELEACVIEAVEDDPSLLDIDFDNLDPASPEAEIVLDIFFSCVPSEVMVDMIVSELEADPSIPAETVACVEEELLALDTDELSDLILGAAAGETAGMEEALGACI
jgi:hypothetical protein